MIPAARDEATDLPHVRAVLTGVNAQHVPLLAPRFPLQQRDLENRHDRHQRHGDCDERDDRQHTLQGVNRMPHHLIRAVDDQRIAVGVEPDVLPVDVAEVGAELDRLRSVFFSDGSMPIRQSRPIFRQQINVRYIAIVAIATAAHASGGEIQIGRVGDG